MKLFIRKNKNYIPLIIAAVMLLGLLFSQKRVVAVNYNSTEDILYNPYMGFAPNADYYEAVGDNTLVYIDVTFREWEPREDYFDIKGIRERNFIDEWEKQGKHAVLRFVCDIPGEYYHTDIPDWLFERMENKEYYDTTYGKGYSPDYTDSYFIKEHKEAIEALGKAFSRDDFVAYVELGSLGHWGEWHVKSDEGIEPFPSENICWEYVDPYLEAFPNAQILMRRPFSFVFSYDFGVFNDMAGAKEDTDEWLDWIKEGGVYEEASEPMELIAVPDIWNNSPVGGEFTSMYSMDEMLTGRLKETVKLLDETHMTFIGPQCPISNDEFIEHPEEVREILNHIGYRYGVERAEFKRNIFTGKTKLLLTIHNNGVAPIYRNYKVCIRETDENGELVQDIMTDINLSDLWGSRTEIYEINLGRTVSLKELNTFVLTVENPETGEAEILLDNKEEDRENKCLVLYEKKEK